MGIEAELGRANVAIRATLDKLDGDLSKAHGTVDRATDRMAKLVKAGFAAAGTAAVAGIGIATGAVAGLATTLGKLAIDAAPVEGIASAFDGLAESAGYGASEMLDALQRGSAGMVSQRDLMLSFNKASQLVSTDFAATLPEAMGYLSKVSASTGQSMSYLMNSLVTGIGRVSPMILDNLGIQVSLSEATARAAEMFGVEEKELTKAQQQAGLTAVVLERLQANTAAMPDTTETAAAKLAQMQARIRDVKDEVGLAFLPTLTELLGIGADLADRVLPPLLDRIGRLAPKVADVAGKVGDFVEELLGGANPLEAFRDLLGGLFPAVAGMDWRELGGSILSRIGAGLRRGAAIVRGWAQERIIGPLSAFLTETDWSAVARRILTRIGEGLLTGYEVVRTWVSDHIVTPISTFIAETDWSAVARRILTRIGEGLLTGYEIVRAWVSDHIVTPISTFITETDWSAVAEGLRTKIGETFDTVRGFVSEKLGGLLDTLLGKGAEAAPAEGSGVLGVLDGIAGFVSGPGGTVLSVLGAIVGLITGIGAPIGIAIGAIKLLSMAWETNFGGIRDITNEVLTNIGAFTEQTVGNLRETVQPLFDSLQTAWAWINTVAIPTVRRWGAAFMRGLQPRLDAMSERLSEFWQTIGPKVRAAWDSIKRAWDRISAVVMEKLWPAIQRLLDALGINVTDEALFEGLGEFVGFLLEANLEALLWLVTAAVDGLALAVEVAAPIVERMVDDTAEWIDMLASLIERIRELSDMSVAEIFEELTGIELPEWLEPGSPPPLYHALMDIGRAMDALAGKQVPAFPGLGGDGPDGAGGGQGPVTLYGPVILEGVQDGRSFIEELQGLAV